VDAEKGLTLTEIADGVTVQEVVETTGCEFQVGIRITVLWRARNGFLVSLYFHKGSATCSVRRGWFVFTLETRAAITDVTS
jgi:hypothetical protein